MKETHVKKIIRLLDEWDYEPEANGEKDSFELYLGDDYYLIRGSVTLEEYGTFTPATYTDPSEFNRLGYNLDIEVDEVWVEDDIIKLTEEEKDKLISKIEKQLRYDR